MRTFYLIIIYCCLLGCSESEWQTSNNRSFDIRTCQVPNNSLYNPKNSIKDRTLYFINKSDTIIESSFDSFGRNTIERRRKWFHRETRYMYLFDTNIPVSKKHHTDYSQYWDSFSYYQHDTLFQVWHDGSLPLDTFMYIFKDNKIQELIGGNLDDYGYVKVSQKFYYKDDELSKIVSTSLIGNIFSTLPTDSIVKYYFHSSGKISKIMESYFLKDKSRNFNRTVEFNSNEEPTKLIERDTIVFTVK